MGSVSNMGAGVEYWSGVREIRFKMSALPTSNIPHDATRFCHHGTLTSVP